MRVFVGGSRERRAAAVCADLDTAHAGVPVIDVHTAAHWPFTRHVVSARPAPAPPVVLWLHDLHLAFPPPRVPGIRLVLTQSTYQLQRLLDRLAAEAPRTIVVADGDARLRSEAAGRRGPWARIEVIDLGPGPAEGTSWTTPDEMASDGASAAALLLHRGTTALEHQRGDEALTLMEAALADDPTWEASHFELGKLWLRREETARAAGAFAEAGRLMPAFAAAWGNLGAALGELERRDEALAALEHALAHDPHGVPIVNNIGAVRREKGQLDLAEQSFRRVIDLEPSFVFGHYNLGHTLLLRHRFGEARLAYEDGFARDPQRNERQGCRLAVARAVSGDVGGALEQLKRVADGVPPEVMSGLAADTAMTLAALEDAAGVDVSAVHELLRSYCS